MSKAVPFPDDFFDSPETDPLNKTDLSSAGKASAAPPPDPEASQRKRGLDSVFAASAPLDEGATAESLQKAILVTRTARTTNGLDELNKALRSGWEMMHVTLMGDSEKNAPWLAEAEADAYFSALVFVEQISNEA